MSVPPSPYCSVPVAGGLQPRSRRAWKIPAISTERSILSLRLRLLRCYRRQFDHHIRADRRNFKSANECGRAPKSRSRGRYRLPKSFPLSSLGIARGATWICQRLQLPHYDILPQRLRKTWRTFDPLNPPDAIALCTSKSEIFEARICPA